MKRNGLFLKYFLSTFLVFLLAILLFALAFSGFSYRYALAEKREAISTTAEVAANAAAARSMDGELSDWELRIQLSCPGGRGPCGPLRRAGHGGLLLGQRGLL